MAVGSDRCRRESVRQSRPKQQTLTIVHVIKYEDVSGGFETSQRNRDMDKV